MPRRHPCFAPLPAPLGLRFRALLGLGFVPPPEPRPCAHCASIAYALLPAARVPLCRHRADPESSSRSLPSGSPARIAPIAPTARRRPRPPLALRWPRGPGWQESHRMHPFSPNARKRPPSWQLPPEMHAFRDQDGNIFALCIHFRAQSDDSGYMARESCRQGPSFASGNPKSRMARRCCQRRAAFSRQRPAVRPNGLCAMRQRHATRGMAERALRPAAWAWPACCMRPSLSSLLCPPRPAAPPPAFIAAVLHASRFAARIEPTHAAIRHAAHCGRGERRSGSSCRPRAAHADASRLPMRARRHRLGPNPRQPSPGPEPTGPRPRANRTSAPSQPSPAHPWSRLLPPAPCHPPRLTLPRGSRCGSGNSREMVR